VFKAHSTGAHLVKVLPKWPDLFWDEVGQHENGVATVFWDGMISSPCLVVGRNQPCFVFGMRDEKG
jgi:hypothetical protein